MAKFFRLSDYDLVCTDWSGVVSNDLNVALETDNRILEENGKPAITMQEFRELDTASPAEFQRVMGLEGTDEELFGLYKRYLAQVLSEGLVPQVLPGAQYALKYLKNRGKKIVVVSNHPPNEIEKEAIRYGVRNYIDDILGGKMDKAKSIRLAFMHNGLSPKGTLFLGDMKADIRAGKAAGVYTGAVCTGYHCKAFLEAEEPDFLFESILDITNTGF